MKKLKVAVLANLKKNAPHWEGMTEDQWDDLDSEKTVLAISLEVGFNSKSAFYEAFSRFTGMSPQSYRKRGGQ